jgi:hypothetical protein
LGLILLLRLSRFGLRRGCGLLGLRCVSAVAHFAVRERPSTISTEFCHC